MDEVDLRLFQLLMINNRLTYRELADELRIALPAVHRRLLSLIDQGIFTKFYANISVGYLKAVPAQLVGITQAKNLDSQIEELVKEDYIEKIFLFGSNLITITTLLPRYDDLGPAVQHIRDTLKIPEPWVVIPATVAAANVPIYRSYSGTRELTRLDYRIINALHDNARRPIMGVADELKISAKTVRSRMDQMIASGAVEFGLDWKPERSSGTSSIMRIELKAGADRDRFVALLNQRFGPRFIITASYHNLPDLIVANCWSPTMDEHTGMMSEIERYEEVALVDSRIVQRTRLFETWRDRLLRERAEGKINP